MNELISTQGNITMTGTGSNFYHPKQYELLTDNIKSIEDVKLVLKALTITITDFNPHCEELIKCNLITPKTKEQQ